MILAVPLNIDWQQILLHLLNFVILVGALYFLLFSPIKKFMAARTAHYQQMNEEATQKLANAKEKDEKISAKLNDLQNEIKNKKLAAIQELDKFKEEQVKEAKIEADSIIKKANEEALRDKKKILGECDEQIRQMVDEATAKIVLNSSCSDAFDQFLDAAEGSEDNGK